MQSVRCCQVYLHLTLVEWEFALHSVSLDSGDRVSKRDLLIKRAIVNHV